MFCRASCRRAEVKTVSTERQSRVCTRRWRELPASARCHRVCEYTVDPLRQTGRALDTCPRGNRQEKSCQLENDNQASPRVFAARGWVKGPVLCSAQEGGSLTLWGKNSSSGLVLHYPSPNLIWTETITAVTQATRS